MRKKKTYGTYLSLLVLTSIVISPMLWIIAISFRDNTEVFAIPPRWIPERPNLHAYRAILDNPEMLRLFTNSYIIAISVTFLCLFLAAPCWIWFLSI